MAGSDVILTGLPGAGSAAIGALIDYLPDTLCLNSPGVHTLFSTKHNSAMPICKWLVGEFYWQRKQIVAQIPIPDYRAANGAPLMEEPAPNAKPQHIARPGLSADFTLAMHHSWLYTAILPTLSEFDYFNIIVVLRDPFDAIAQWQKNEAAFFSADTLSMLARLWPQAHHIATAQTDGLTRMVQLYELFCERYHTLGSHIRVIKYEDVAHDPMQLSALFGKRKLSANAAALPLPAPILDAEIKKAMQQYGVFAKQFYPG